MIASLWALLFFRQRVDYYARACNPRLGRLTKWSYIDIRGVNGLRGIRGVEICKVTTTRRKVLIDFERVQ